MCYKPFSYALEQLEQGKCVTRARWAEGWFLYLVKGSVFQVNRKPLIDIFPEGREINYQAHIDLFTPNNRVMVFTPSQEDLLGQDYYVVDTVA
jgi:hypothetical protein